MSVANERTIGWVEQGLVPDRVVRAAIRRLLQRRLDELRPDDVEGSAASASAFVAMMNAAEIAPLADKANEQHYELPAAFFEAVLGAQRKYSACHWAAGTDSLDAAEEAALAMTASRAGIEDGMQVLELGCGWGALTLWLARRFPAARITAVSNSHAQRAYIERRAEQSALTNVEVITADMNAFDTERRFERVVSVEMFEHLRNYREAFARIADWLQPGGRFFMHIFCHRSTPYEFVDRDADDWMSRHFFSGGIMPSDTLPLHFQQHLALRNHWRWSGRHYERTLNAWLARMDARKATVMPILRETYGEEAALWWTRWRLFFMACAELFGYRDGREWFVSHYLFERAAR